MQARRPSTTRIFAAAGLRFVNADMLGLETPRTDDPGWIDQPENTRGLEHARRSIEIQDRQRPVFFPADNSLSSGAEQDDGGHATGDVACGEALVSTRSGRPSVAGTM